MPLSEAGHLGDPSGLDPESVAAFLRGHPRFLADNPDLYRRLTPPARVHGDTMADHMAAMLRAERTHAAAMSERAEDVLAAGRAAAGLAARVHEAVLALIAASDPVDCVSSAFPAILALDAAAICAEARLPGTRLLPAGAVAGCLGGRAVVFRQAPRDTVMLHGEAALLACHDALVRIPVKGAPALLALATRDRTALDPAQGTGPLAFLGRALAAALGG